MSNKLRWVGISTAVFSWIAAVCEISFFAIEWFLHKKTFMYGVINEYSTRLPQLISPNFHMSSISSGLVIAVDGLFPLISSIGLIITGFFFLHLFRREIWSNRNIIILYILGSLCIIYALLPSLYDSLMILILSFDLPKGSGLFSFSIGVNQAAWYKILSGIFLISFGLILREIKIMLDKKVP
jgi:hypothetical protein